MKLAFISDCHLGNHNRFGGETTASLNRRARLVLQTLTRARERALTHGASQLFVLGDLFDAHNPIPQLIGAAGRVMEEGGTWNILMGNHDQKGPAAGDNALVAFGHSKIRCFEAPEVVEIPVFKGRRVDHRLSVLVVPYGPGQAIEVLRAAVVKTGVQHADLVLLHAGIRDPLTPPWLRDAADSIEARDLFEVMKGIGARLALAGNWHDARRWVDGDRAIYQVGSLCPTGFDNEGLDGYGLLATVDLETFEVDAEEIPGPRFCKVGSIPQLEELAAELRKFPAGYSVFVEYMADPQAVDSAVVWLAGMESEGLIAGWEIVPDRRLAETLAREAAEAASQQQTTEQAVAAYVAHMDLPSDFNRQELTARCIAFLGGRSGA